MEGPLYLAIFYIIVHYTVGWSDFVLFLYFQNWAHCCRSDIHLVNCQFLPCARGACAAKFSHLKNSQVLNKFIYIYIFLNWKNFHFTLKTIAKKKIWNEVLFNIFCWPAKLAKLILPMVKAKHILFTFS